jgi:NTE family protein
MKETIKIAVALQGGGAHGAFAWGALDRLLEEEDLEISAWVGASAGAMNAAIAAYGMQVGGRLEAKRKLEEFWRAVAAIGLFSPVKPTLWDRFLSPGSMLTSPFYWMAALLKSIASPYQFNPFNFNPLRTILKQVIDFEKLKTCAYPDLFVCATNLKECRPVIFHKEQITVDSLLASACIPSLFQAVEKDDAAYWDGGFMGNPPLFPILRKTNLSDILLIQINPIKINHIPKTTPEIEDRLNEISFNSSLIWELNWIDYVNKLIQKKILQGKEFREIYIHAISADKALAGLDYSSKMNTELNFLQYLRALGRRYANDWLSTHKKSLGKESSFKIEQYLWLIKDID